MTDGKWAGERFHTPITLGSVPRTGLITGTRSELAARRAKGAGLNCPRLRESTAILEFVTSYTPGWRPTEPDDVNTPQHSDRVPDGAPVEPDVDGQFIKYVGFCVPRRWVTPETMDLDGMVAEIEEIVRTRGLVAYDGQVITSLRCVGEWEEWKEFSRPGSPDIRRDIPGRRHWGPEQHAFFGIEQPYQMSDDEDPFTRYSISAEISDPYLTPGELIAGLVYGARERCAFTCPCHSPHVVYTTRHRLVCMSCGATHVVLREPVLTAFRQTIAPEEWGELFGDEGSRHHEQVDLAIVDVQNIESAAPFVWSTNQWAEVLRLYVLCARMTPEEFQRAVRGTELDASVLMEDGWLAVEEPPAPASQVMDDSVDVGMMDGAGHALTAGASAYLAGYVHPERLIDAVKNLFQTIELLLKVRLEASDPLGLRGQPNNPTVIARLATAGVTLPPDEVDTVAQIRRLRNDLQHNAARFNHRRVLGLCRSALIVIDRFAVEELDNWAGDIISPDEWHQLLSIEEIRARAVTVAQTRLDHYRDNPEASITTCPRCTHEAMLRRHPDTGASCLLCGYIPVVED